MDTNKPNTTNGGTMKNIQVVDGILNAQDSGRAYSFVYNTLAGRVIMVSYFDHNGSPAYTQWFI